jgi:hypothetical protein
MGAARSACDQRGIQCVGFASENPGGARGRGFLLQNSLTSPESLAIRHRMTCSSTIKGVM